MPRLRFSRLLLSAVLWMVGRPKTTLAAVAVAVIASGVLAFSILTVSTDQDELFSSEVPFFRHYIEFTGHFPENQANYVIIEARDPAHPPATEKWTAAADAIAADLARHPEWVRVVYSHNDVDKLGPAGLLLDDPAAVQKNFADITDLAGVWTPAGAVNRKLFGNSATERFVNKLRRVPPTAEQAEFLKLLGDGWAESVTDPKTAVAVGKQVPDLAKLGVNSPRDLGYDFIPDETDNRRMMLLVPVYEQDIYNRRNGMSETIDGIRGVVNQTAARFPEFEVGISGRPTLEADEMKTTDTDARWSEIAALTAVFIGLVVLLRSIWLAVAAEIALLIGIALTFGWAAISVHRLNLLSMVFLIALTGIGMDYLVQVLTRYRRESARRSDPRVIWTGVFRYVAAPINTACLGAAGAFLVSYFTDFRGAEELGIIAGGGLLLCLLTGYVVLPPLLTLFPAKPRPQDNDRKVVTALGDSLQPITGWRRHKWLVLPGVWAVLLLCAIPFAREARFDPSLLKMQSQQLPSVQLIRKLPTWSAVVLSTDINQLRTARTAVQPLESTGIVKRTDSLLTAFDNEAWLNAHKSSVPVLLAKDYDSVSAADVAGLAGSIDALAVDYRPKFPDTAAALDRAAAALRGAPPEVAAARMSAWQSVFIAQLRTLLLPFTPTKFDPQALPPSIRGHYIGTDGEYALYVEPRQDLWDQQALGRFTTDIEKAVHNSPAKSVTVTGIAVNVWHSTSSIERSFHKATGYALALIFVLVLIDLRNLLQTILAISVLAMGLPMLVALMGLFHINWNFANFFGLPILIGAGHEYGVFMVHRYNEACGDTHRPWRRWDVSDKALLSCAYVTSASFGFFWLLGHHEGLKSLGLVMALGTACIYLATLFMLRPLLLWKLARRDQCRTPSDKMRASSEKPATVEH